MKKKICAIVAFIIVFGLVLIATVGLNVSLDYAAHTMIDVSIGQQFNISDIKAITKEIYPNEKVVIEKSTAYKDGVCIKVTGTSDEQVESLNQKINEKYGIDNKIEDINKIYVSNTRLRDVLKPYIIPLLITTVLVLIYLIIRFKNLGILNVLIQTAGAIGISELLLLALVAITRYPIDRIIMPAALVLYFAILITMSYRFTKSENDKISEGKISKKETKKSKEIK